MKPPFSYGFPMVSAGWPGRTRRARHHRPGLRGPREPQKHHGGALRLGRDEDLLCPKLVGGFPGTWLLFSQKIGMSSSQLTNSNLFQGGIETTNQEMVWPWWCGVTSQRALAYENWWTLVLHKQFQPLREKRNWRALWIPKKTRWNS